MEKPARRVAIIGAGPGGAIATDAFVKEQAFETIRVFERRGKVGGQWIYDENEESGPSSLDDLVAGKANLAVPTPSDFPAVTSVSKAVNSLQSRFSATAMHQQLHTNIAPKIMSFTQEPFPDTLSERTLRDFGPTSDWRHHTVVRQWIEDILNPHKDLLELNTTVEKADYLDGEWVLTLRKETDLKTNHWWQEKFDAVVVASGHYYLPWYPSDIPGMVEYNKKYPGRILHSKYFRTADKFRNKRVIVVGASVSSHEVIHEILDVAQMPVYSSHRGEPIPIFGWAPFLHPHIALKKQIARFEESGRIYFMDGSYVDDVDYIIFGTGFTYSMPFIPYVQERLDKSYRRLSGVYQHVWDIENPSLTFVGMSGGGFTFMVYEWQAVTAARHLACRSGKPLPSKKDMRAWESKRVEERGEGKAFYNLAPDYEEYFQILADFAGEPVANTAGRKLPPFDKSLLQVWVDMIKPKVWRWETKRKLAEEALRN